MQGPVVGDLMAIAAEAQSPLTQWATAVAAASQTDWHASWSTAEVTEMRSAVLEAVPPALEALAVTAAAQTCWWLLPRQPPQRRCAKLSPCSPGANSATPSSLP